MPINWCIRTIEAVERCDPGAMTGSRRYKYCYSYNIFCTLLEVQLGPYGSGRRPCSAFQFMEEERLYSCASPFDFSRPRRWSWPA